MQFVVLANLVLEDTNMSDIRKTNNGKKEKFSQKVFDASRKVPAFRVKITKPK
jgi:hypothetical protein